MLLIGQRKGDADCS